MPFRSKAQQRYLFAKHPDVARRFAAETPADAYKKLPDHAGGRAVRDLRVSMGARRIARRKKGKGR